jgi:hypothetical protein
MAKTDLYSREEKRKAPAGMTFTKAVELGEYEPEFLELFEEYRDLSKISQWNYVLKALKNRKAFLLNQYAETFNLLDFSQKPELKRVLDSIVDKQKRLSEEEEMLRIKFLTED